jgi:hypothetical protein
MLNNIVVQHSVGIRIQSANIAAFDTTEWGSGSWANEKDWDGALISTIRNEWGDPRFVAPEQEDYHLRNDSHALDRASPSSVMRDIDGQPRLGQPDIGADEYAASVHLPLIARK